MYRSYLNFSSTSIGNNSFKVFVVRQFFSLLLLQFWATKIFFSTTSMAIVGWHKRMSNTPNQQIAWILEWNNSTELRAFYTICCPKDLTIQ
mmetsp:Transcript_672/g.1389  ORF Transcript_672/g.1389 Transcript_672/m.1389 type:complete len:91 (+) Transcript_672:95-367(+)